MPNKETCTSEALTVTADSESNSETIEYFCLRPQRQGFEKLSINSF